MRHGKTNQANTKQRINKNFVSRHTLRFRESVKAPMTVRTLSSVGGIRGNRKYSRRGSKPNFNHIAPITGIQFRIAAGLQSMMTAATQTLRNLLPKSKRELKRNV